MRTVKEIFASHEVLDAEGRHINGTDKSGPNHQYGDAYERMFPNRAEVRLMMEVGVADGSSVLAWREVFPNAMCVGMDVHPADRLRDVDTFSGAVTRVEFYLGDQRVKEDCERAAGGRQFDFICEDATHQLGDSLVTLLYLWPFIKMGGLYVVEEFASVGALRRNIRELLPFAEIVDTVGPSGGVEPLVALRKVWQIHERA